MRLSCFWFSLIFTVYIQKLKPSRNFAGDLLSAVSRGLFCTWMQKSEWWNATAVDLPASGLGSWLNYHLVSDTASVIPQQPWLRATSCLFFFEVMKESGPKTGRHLSHLIKRANTSSISLRKQGRKRKKKKIDIFCLVLFSCVHLQNFTVVNGLWHYYHIFIIEKVL